MNIPRDKLEKIEEALLTAYDRLDMIDPDGTYKDWDDQGKVWFGPAVEKAEVWEACELMKELLKEDV